MGGLPVDWTVHWTVPRFLAITARLLGSSSKTLILPIHKTSDTRRHLLTHSRVAHHSEVCFVFGPTEFTVYHFPFSSERHRDGFTKPLSFLAHGFRSLSLVTIYNVFYFLSISFVHFYPLHNNKPVHPSKTHKCPCRNRISGRGAAFHACSAQSMFSKDKAFSVQNRSKSATRFS